MYIYIYIYIERERERQTDRQTDTGDNHFDVTKQLLIRECAFFRYFRIIEIYSISDVYRRRKHIIKLN